MDINEIIIQLNIIKNTFQLFHSNVIFWRDKKVEDIFNDSENISTKVLRSQQIADDIKTLLKWKPTCKAIIQMKNLLLFKIVYEYA